MEFRGFGHVCLVVSDFDACVAFYEKVMRHLGMKPYVAAPPFFKGWFADESSKLIADR